MRRTKAEILMELCEARLIIALELRSRGVAARADDPWEDLARWSQTHLIGGGDDRDADSLVTCWTCDGDGIDPADGHVCSRCGGSGEVVEP